jgi:hypothetical protein
MLPFNRVSILAALRALGSILTACLATATTSGGALAQAAAALPSDVRVIERRQDFTTFEVDQVERNERGEEVTRTSRFTLLEA